jgi:ABC-type Fe3+ transport system permease subunit
MRGLQEIASRRVKSAVVSRVRKGLLAAALGLSIIVILIVVYVLYERNTVRTNWRRIDSAARRFERPDGLEQVARVRQGTAFCWVTCTRGGEAVVTLVFSSSIGVAESCENLRRSLTALSNSVTLASDQSTCSWKAALGHGATARASVDEASNLTGRGSGWRWMDKVAIPSSKVVAWVEFKSGIE